MDKKILVYVAAILFTACTANQKLQIDNFSAVQNYKKHNYNKSIETWYTAAAATNNKATTSYYIKYNLALAYNAIGETLAAEKIYNELVQTEEAKIKLHSYFQLGVHYFKDKNYTAALQAFKNAIQTDSTFMPAKINYELCLQFLTQEKNKTKQTQQKQADSKNETTILDFIKEKEVQLWSEQNTEKTQKNAYDY